MRRLLPTRERWIAALGAFLGIALTAMLSGLIAGHGGALPSLIIAPMGASAVLLFAVPASPLAQPWSMAGGNIVSALVGILCAMLIPTDALAAAVAVGGAIFLMMTLRCLHPPGGAVALLCVVMQVETLPHPLAYAAVPVALNVGVLLLSALAYHRWLSGHSYPHHAPPVARAPAPMRVEDIEAAMADYPEILDIDPEDLYAIAQRAAARASERR